MELAKDLCIGLVDNTPHMAPVGARGLIMRSNIEVGPQCPPTPCKFLICTEACVRDIAGF